MISCLNVTEQQQQEILIGKMERNRLKSRELKDFGAMLEGELREEIRRIELTYKVKMDEHARQVRELEMEARKLEEEMALGQSAESINHHHHHPVLLDLPVPHQSGTVDTQPIFSTEIFMFIAPHLPAKDQLSLRSLNKDISGAIPKLLHLNFRYFKESFDRLLNGFNEVKLISQIPVHFKLDPKEVELNPYGVLELGHSIVEGNYPYDNDSPAVQALLGASLKVAVPEVLKRSHKHPKFKLLTLHSAALANCREAIHFLLSVNGNTALPQYDFDDDLHTSLHTSCQGGFDDIVKLLLQNPRVDPACYDNLSISLASQEGRTSTVQLLLEDPRVSPEANDNNAIRIAAEYGHFGVAKLLLEDERVDMKANNLEALRDAHKHNHQNIVKILLDHFVAHPGDDEEDDDDDGQD